MSAETKSPVSFMNAKNELAHIGITLTRKDGEYRVNFVGGKEVTAYYTNDLMDALGTGKAMKLHDKALAAVEGSAASKVFDDKLAAMAGQMVREQEEARAEFIKCCRSVARDLEEAADSAEREDHRIVSASVLSSSYLRDIAALSSKYATLSAQLIRIRTLQSL